MQGGTAGKITVGIGVVVVLGAAYNLATLPDIPETDDGILGLIVRTAVEDFTEVLEWIATTAVVNSVILLLVGVALIIMGFNMHTGSE